MGEYRLGRFIWAGGLVFFGLLLLLFNFGLLAGFEPLARLVLAGLFVVAGLGFFVAYLQRSRDWTQLIPGWTLLSLAAMIFTSTLPTIDQRLSAALLFIGLGAAFVHIHLLNRRERWWALIPGGFMFVVGIVIGLSTRIVRAEALAALLFGGMGTVFFLIYILGDKQRQWWALVPGSVLLVFSAFVFARSAEASGALLRWWPLTLIVLGLILGLLAYRRTPPDKLVIHTAPSATVQTPAKDKTTPPRAALGDYTQPAPGATIDVLPEE